MVSRYGHGQASSWTSSSCWLPTKARQAFAWWDGERVRTALHDEFARLYAEGVIDDETPVFDPLVDNLGAFRSAFVKPLRESWHQRMVL